MDGRKRELERIKTTSTKINVKTLEKSCFRCKKNTWHVESKIVFYSLQSIWLLLLIGLAT